LQHVAISKTKAAAVTGLAALGLAAAAVTTFANIDNSEMGSFRTVNGERVYMSDNDFRDLQAPKSSAGLAQEVGNAWDLRGKRTTLVQPVGIKWT